MKRPLAWIGFSASAALLLAGFGGLPVAIVLLAAGIIGGVVLGILLRRYPLYAWLTVCLSVACATGVFIAREITFLSQETFAGQTLSLTMQLTEETKRYSQSTYYTATVTDGELPAGTRVRVWLPTSPEYGLFDHVTGRVTFYPLDDDEFLRQNKADGVVLNGYVDTWDAPLTVTPGESSFQQMLQSVRHAAVDTVEHYLAGDSAAIVRGICLGNRQTLSPMVSEHFRKSGTSHLLVVSGLHLSMIAVAVTGLLRLLRVRRRLSAMLSIVAVLAFMCLVGFTPSARRAGVMLLVMLAGQLFKRESDGLNSLGLALFLIGMADPYMVWDVGLQLSVGSVAGILLLNPYIERRFLQPYLRDNDRCWIGWLYKPAQAISVSLSATALIWPLLGWYFGDVSLVFLVANLLMVYPATVAVITGLCGVLTGGWFPFLGKICFFLSGTLVDYLNTVAAWLGDLPFATLYVRYGYVAVWALLCIPLLALLWKKITVVRRLMAGLCAVIVLAVGTATYHIAMQSVTTCFVLRSDEGMAAFMKWDEGNLLAVSGADKDLLFRTVAKLEERRINHLSAVVFPDLEDTALASLPILTQSFVIDRVFCSETGRYAPAVKDLFADGQRTMAQEITFNIGAEHRFTLRQGWLYAQTGNTTWLFSADDNADLPPPEWRQADGVLALNVPSDANWPDASLGVSGNIPETDVPWLVLPSGESVELFTREDGTVYVE